MTHTEDPQPLDDGPFQDYVWPVLRAIPFGQYCAPIERSFLDVFEGRRSVRALMSVPLEALVDALRLALVPRLWKEGDPLRRSRRPALSGGALHAISVLLFAGAAVYRVNAAESVLEELNVSADLRVSWVSKCQRVLPDADGAFIVLIADMARPMAAYENSESLVWRDSGALLQTLALAAESYGLGFCPLGILGNEVVDALPKADQLLAVGAAAIGLPA
ncbi:MULTISPECIES: nitroreductase family protein [Paraburkholderia]|uniref:nitroreductase family protein n=1 Tax=Paraburkholderia TaxID=1822464 RepID=UPI002257B1A9|nr:MULTISPECIES: nitroreductase family protein [Paraburkholderia]MCX4156309.1 nitroreductase family protein [Paraburkholderia aspalathi]MDN7165714.1 nitroreductase family protein [Paraburkholderia sp. SECH2]MDQ6394200.1 nitroreductase family protein [Paraburkholderia aspalathi]